MRGDVDYTSLTGHTTKHQNILKWDKTHFWESCKPSSSVLAGGFHPCVNTICQMVFAGKRAKQGLRKVETDHIFLFTTTQYPPSKTRW